MSDEEFMKELPSKKRKHGSGISGKGKISLSETFGQLQKSQEIFKRFSKTSGERSRIPPTCTITSNELADSSNTIKAITKDKVAATKSSEEATYASPIAEENYSNFVTPEVLEQLRRFQVLDEVNSNDEDSKDEDSDDSDGKSRGLSDSEIERMLEEDLPDNLKGPSKTREKPFSISQKVVLEEKGVNQFEVLPLDWIMVWHISGMPIYMHRPTRVCTVSKPYFLGKNNMRNHAIPISAIPCLAYRKALEEEEKQNEIDMKIEEQIRTGNWHNDNNDGATEQAGTSNSGIEQNPNIARYLKSDKLLTEAAIPKEELLDTPSSSTCPFDVNSEAGLKPLIAEERARRSNQEVPLNRQPVVLPDGKVMPPPRVETVNTSWKTQDLTAEQINDYCKKLFKFKTVNTKRFKTWADRRKYIKARKTLQYPTLPEGTKLITIPAQPGVSGQQNAGKSTKRDWVMNMNDCSYVSVFHEYVRRALQKQPVYQFKQLENAAQPYQCIVFIGGMQYGVGYGSSKRQAKSEAARASIHILIPEMKDDLEAADPQKSSTEQTEFPTFFDLVGIEDPRVADFCTASCEPSPHAILRTCLVRNFGAGDKHVYTEIKKMEHQKIELTMTVGKHTASVICKNKKIAKQRASQAILQALHPHVKSWGSLLRMYGSNSVKSVKEKKVEEREITALQDKARHNQPNFAVLEKLREEMRKLRERDEAITPIGTLVVKDDLPTHSGSNLNTVDI